MLCWPDALMRAICSNNHVLTVAVDRNLRHGWRRLASRALTAVNYEAVMFALLQAVTVAWWLCCDGC
jgi:hypothetical protein